VRTQINWYYVNTWDSDCSFADMDDNNTIDLRDFAILADYWRQSTSGPEDLDDSGFVDYAILASQWLQAPSVPSADIAPLGGDGIVNILDLGALADNWLAG
jgi:hypothetical protein